MKRLLRTGAYGATRVLLGMLVVLAPTVAAQQQAPPGFSLVEDAAPGGSRQLLAGPSGQRYELVGEGSLTSFQLEALQELDALIPQLQSLRFSRIQVEPRGSGLAVLGLPAELTIGGEDYLPFVPAGIGGTWSRGFLPDFSVFVDGRRIRIQGTIADEAELLDSIAAAVADPAAFLRSQDPRVLAERIGQLAARVTAAEDGLAGLADEVEALEQTDTALQEADAALGLAAAELETTLNNRLNDELAAAVSQLQLAIRQVQTALAFSRNEAFFGGLQAIPDETIDAVLDAYDSLDDPNVSSVRDAVSAAGLSVGAREVEAILLAFRSFLP